MMVYVSLEIHSGSVLLMNMTRDRLLSDSLSDL